MNIKSLPFLIAIMMILVLPLATCGKSAEKSEPPIQTYAVSFNTNGAAAIERQAVIPGGTATEPEKPVLIGCGFGGWYTDNSFERAYDFSSPVETNIFLHAKWIPEISMVPVPGGNFLMGSENFMDLDAKPVHQVTLSGFSMGKYQVTQAQYRAVIGFNPSYFTQQEEAANCPVEQITWFEAVEFCNVLSEQEGLTPVYTIDGRTPAAGYPITGAEVTANWGANGYRLPTEAEWEYAAKGGNGMGPYFVYSGSDTPGAVAWYNFGFGSSQVTKAVGQKEPNSLGLYDMSGNVWEWCWDWYDEYQDNPVTNPKGPTAGSGKVMRGGSWSMSGEVIRIAYRNFYIESITNCYIGLRVVRNMQ